MRARAGPTPRQPAPRASQMTFPLPVSHTSTGAHAGRDHAAARRAARRVARGRRPPRCRCRVVRHAQRDRHPGACACAVDVTVCRAPLMAYSTLRVRARGRPPRCRVVRHAQRDRHAGAGPMHAGAPPMRREHWPIMLCPAQFPFRAHINTRTHAHECMQLTGTRVEHIQ